MKKKHIIGIIVAVVLVAAMIFAYTAFSEKTTAGSKNITIEVINSKEESTLYEVSTDAEYLIGAMDEAKELTYDGSEGEYGFTVSTINGETADFTVDSSYWSFYVNGEYCNYGVSEQPINDGDAFQIIYTAY